MEDWEKGEGNPSKPIPTNANKWAGEDEDDVLDSWDVEDEEKKDEEKVEIKFVKAKPKKSLGEKIAEKERLKREEEEAREAQREAELSPEQKLAEKLRLQKIQEEADLRAAIDTFGVCVDDKDRSGIDGMHPTNKAELSEFSEALSKKIGQYKQLADFPQFVEDVVRGICSNLTSTDMQKIKKTVDTLYTEKQKMEKEKSKKSGKGKGKATIRKIEDNENIKDYGDDPYDYDDFM